MSILYSLARRALNCYMDSKILRNKKTIIGDRISLIQGNEKYKNIHSGERCFIIGNGPSLNNMDLSLLKNEYVFTVNQLSKNIQFENIKTNYHFWADERFFKIDEDNEGDLALLQTMKNVNTSGNTPVVFYDILAYDMIKKFKLDEMLDIHYFVEARINVDRYYDRNNIDMAKIMPTFPTVIFNCIMFAIYMGFSEIYLLGVDCTGFITIAQTKMKENDNIQYAFELSLAERNRLQEANNKYSIGQELYSYSRIFENYEKVNVFAKKRNIKLFNATPGGLLDSIERVDYMSLFTN